MPAQSVPIGMPTPITQNVAYAMPPKLVFCQSSVAVEGSADGSVWTALTNVNTTGANVGAAFVRCPTANAVIVCKSY